MSAKSKLELFSEIRNDCLIACDDQSDILNKLTYRRIAITGGTGFLGTWIAEMVACLNDERNLNISLDLYARNTSEWKRKWPHLSDRNDIQLYPQDIRSSFQFQFDTDYIIHAAGTPNNRVHASDPIFVIQTTIDGIKNALDAASQLPKLTRFINVSSGLVNGISNSQNPLTESDFFAIPAGQLHLVYVDAKRAAESIATTYRSQFRMPISTIRPFTFVGPYQALDCPWAINNFFRDALAGRDIRIHGDGRARRSYLYGSDAAWWTLASLVYGINGAIYNMGGSNPISHMELAQLISKKMTIRSNITTNSIPAKEVLDDIFFPDTTHTQRTLNVVQTCNLESAIHKMWLWHSNS